MLASMRADEFAQLLLVPGRINCDEVFATPPISFAHWREAREVAKIDFRQRTLDL